MGRATVGLGVPDGTMAASGTSTSGVAVGSVRAGVAVAEGLTTSVGRSVFAAVGVGLAVGCIVAVAGMMSGVALGIEARAEGSLP